MFKLEDTIATEDTITEKKGKVEDTVATEHTITEKKGKLTWVCVVCKSRGRRYNHRTKGKARAHVLSKHGEISLLPGGFVSGRPPNSNTSKRHGDKQGEKTARQSKRNANMFVKES